MSEQSMPEEVGRRLRAAYYFKDDSDTLIRGIIQEAETVFAVKSAVIDLVQSVSRRAIAGAVHRTASVDGDVIVEAGATIGAGAHVVGPAVIRSGAEIRHGAYVRDCTYVCSGAIVGHASEVTRSLVGPYARVAHFGFVGDTLLGKNVNLGSHVVTTSLRLENPVEEPATVEILCRVGPWNVPTGYTKFGAVIGDRTRVAAHVSLGPGTLIGPDCQILMSSQISGAVPRYSRVRT